MSLDRRNVRSLVPGRSPSRGLNSLASGGLRSAPHGSVSSTGTGMAVATVAAGHLDAANRRTQETHDMVSLLESRLSAQGHDLEEKALSLNAIQRNFERLHEKFVQNRTTDQEMTKTVANLQAECEFLRSRVADLQQAVADSAAASESSAAASGARIQDLNATVCALKQDNANLSTQLSVYALQSCLGELFLDEASLRRAIVEEWHSVLQGCCTDLWTMCICELAASNASVKQDLSRVTGLHADLQAAYSAMSNEAAESAEAQQCAARQIDSLQQVLRESEVLYASRLAALERQVSVAEAESSGLCGAVGEVVALKTRLSELESLALDSQRTAAMKDETIAELSQSVAALKTQLADAAAARDTLGDTASSQAEARLALEKKLSNAEADRIATEEALRLLKSEHGALCDDHIVLKKELRDVQDASSLLQQLVCRLKESGLMAEEQSSRSQLAEEFVCTLVDSSVSVCCALRLQLTRLERLLCDSAFDSAALRQQVTDLTLDIANYEQRCKHDEEKLAHFVHDLGERDATLELKAELQHKKEMELQREIASLKAECRSLLETSDGLRLEISRLEGLNVTLRMQADRTDTHLRKREEELSCFAKELCVFIARLRNAEEGCTSALSCVQCFTTLKGTRMASPCGHVFCQQCAPCTGDSCSECSAQISRVLPAEFLDVLAGAMSYRRQTLADMYNAATHFSVEAGE